MGAVIRWIFTLGLALLLGSTLVQYQVTHPLRMSAYLAFSCLALFVLVVVLARYFSGGPRLAAILLSLGACAAGWYIMTAVVLDRQDHRPMPELVRQKGDPGDGHTAVIYLTHGEPPVYDPISWINQMNEFDEQGLKFIPFMARPFFFYWLRQSYLRVGKGWMSFKYPKPATEVERLHANGVDKLFFFSYTISAAGMHAQFDIPALVYKGEVPDEFPIINLGAWGNDPTAIRALKEKIDAVLEPASPAAAKRN